MRQQLILTLTRACNLRCSYCPTAKDGWPSLQTADVREAIRIFSDEWGGGSIKLFGGEPLLEPKLVEEALKLAHEKQNIDWIYLSTNGLPLTKDRIRSLVPWKKLILTLSVDGTEKDHQRMRRSLEGVPNSYRHILSVKEELLRVPRLVVTQTIAPATASHAYENFRHLYSMGFRRFNFLPGYYIPWREHQLRELEIGFQSIEKEIRLLWKRGEYLYVRNLFVQAPTPFFNTGLIVDSDRSIHASNLGLSSKLDSLREQTKLGDLDNPPTKQAVIKKAEEINSILASSLPPNVWSSTQKVDAGLTQFCTQLWPHFLRYRKKKKDRSA
ncbi:MAG: radical SAM protein [Myxococcota bacterium]|nr:radical SAM protein [Myxococcota bacterium]